MPVAVVGPATDVQCAVRVSSSLAHSCCRFHCVFANQSRRGHTPSGLCCFPISGCPLAISDETNTASDRNENASGCNDNAAGTGRAPKNKKSEIPPAAAPREYVVGLYNAYAETFDSHLQEALEYRTPAVIVESLAVLFPERR